MPYSERVTRTNPGCVLFLIDESDSMGASFGQGTKAAEVADVLNRTLNILMTRCYREDGVRDYFDVGILGYHSNDVVNRLPGDLSSQVLQPISKVHRSPLTVEDRYQKIPDGAGGVVEVSTKFPVWYRAKVDGSTPMCAALIRVAEELAEWCDTHPQSFPPIIMHLTDGASTDGDPVPVASQLRQIATNDGSVLLLNIHIAGGSAKTCEFPHNVEDLPGDLARTLFEMSSILPPPMLETVAEMGYEVSDTSRAYMFNAKYEDVVNFFEMGTTTAVAMLGPGAKVNALNS